MSNRLKLKVRTKIPAALLGGVGVNVTKDGLIYKIDLDYSQIAETSTFDPNFVQVAIWNQHTNEWARVSLTDFLNGTLSSATFDAISPTTTRGDIIFRNATTNARLAAGTAGYHLQANGAGADPSYAGFLQSGTGAVTRPWLDKAREIVSAQDFGAIGNGVANDSAPLQAFFQYCIDNPVEGYIPAGTFLTTGHDLNAVTANITSLRIRGAGMGRTIIKLKDSSNTNLIVAIPTGNIATGGGNRNMHFSHFTIDGNSPNQQSNSYTTFFEYVKGFTFDHIELKNPYSTLLWVSQDDTRGSGPSDVIGSFTRHLMPVPAAEQLNQNVQILNCVLDGSAQVVPHDIFVAGSIDGLIVRECTVRGAHTAGISVQFCKNFSVVNNDIQHFWWGIYVETSQRGNISGNKIRTLNFPYLSDITAAGIWLVSAIASYPPYQYSGCSDIKVTNNDIYGLAKSTGTADVYGIRVTGLTGGTVDARRIIIQHNNITDLSAVGGGSAIGIGSDGSATLFDISHNNISNVSICINQGENFVWASTTYTGIIFGATIQGNSLSNAPAGYRQSPGAAFVDFTSLMGNVAPGVTSPYNLVTQTDKVNANNI